MGLDVVRLLDHLGIERAHIVGYSLSANIVSQLLTTHPSRFLTATLVASAGRLSWTSEEEVGFEKQAAEIERGDAKPGFDPLAIAAMLRSFRDQVITPQQAAAVRVPTLGVVGSADPFLPAMEELRGLRAAMKLVIVDGATHGGPLGIVRRPELISAFREHAGVRRQPARSTPDDEAPVVVARAKQYDMISRINGQTYRVMVATPFKAEPDNASELASRLGLLHAQNVAVTRTISRARLQAHTSLDKTVGCNRGRHRLR